MAEIETAILEHALENACHGAMRVEQELRLKSIQVASGSVRGPWQRHNILNKHQRLLRLEKATGERHIEAPFAGALVVNLLSKTNEK